MTETNLFSDETDENNENIDDLDLSTAGNKEENKQKDKNDKKDQTKEFSLNANQLALISSLLRNVKENNDKLLEILGAVSPDIEAKISIGQIGDEQISAEANSKPMESGRIIEGVFDGENMIGPDGKQYSVPANYASKSKLVEGDILKLTITSNGTFVYKQIGPIERQRVVGTIATTESGNYIVNSDDKKWRVLTASVTYFKGQAGDEIVILVPKSGESKWAAVENIVRNKQ